MVVGDGGPHNDSVCSSPIPTFDFGHGPDPDRI